MVEGSGLENRRGETHRGFESLLLRQTSDLGETRGETTKSRETAGSQGFIATLSGSSDPVTIRIVERWPRG